MNEETPQPVTRTPLIPSVPSLLIVLMGSLGDVTRGLCLVHHIKDHWPEIRISWLIEPKWIELVKLNRQIDEIIVFERAWRLAPVKKLKKELDDRHFDITLDLQRHFKSGYFSYLSGSQRRIGFHRKNAKEFNWVFNNEHIGFYSDELPKLNHYLKFTEYLGMPSPTFLDFGISNLSLGNIDPERCARIKAKACISVILGSSWTSKDWFPDQYRRLIQILLRPRDRQVILLGDASQIPLADALTGDIGSSGIINTVGRTPLIELIAILKSSVAAVGPDSGPGHLAAAVGTPYVSLFGPTSPRRVAPFGCEHLVVQADVDCRPCNKKRCPRTERICMQRIRMEDVEKKLSQAMAMGRIQHRYSG